MQEPMEELRKDRQERQTRFSLRIFDRDIHVTCQDTRSAHVLREAYSHFLIPLAASHSADLSYTVRPQNQEFFLKRVGSEVLHAQDDGEFLFLFEKDITIELQKQRRDLYFLHAASLAWHDQEMLRALLLVAASGHGKSTTTWALLHHGFSYLSDELGPIDLSSMQVHPYPHALCLKDKPPPPYRLPSQTLSTSHTLHVPFSALPNTQTPQTPQAPHASPLAAIFFLRYCPEAAQPSLRPIGKAEAATRLFAQALNPLAHPGEGLDGALAIVSQSACFELYSADLTATCTLVKETLEGLE